MFQGKYDYDTKMSSIEPQLAMLRIRNPTRSGLGEDASEARRAVCEAEEVNRLDGDGEAEAEGEKERETCSLPLPCLALPPSFCTALTDEGKGVSE